MKIRYFIITMMLMLYPIFLQGAVEPKAIIEAKAAIRNVLNDPASAQFKDLQIKKGDVTWVSGLFNAKNGFGGYGNFEKFVYIPTYKQLILEKVQAELMTQESKSTSGSYKQFQIYKKYFIDEW